ncbi:lipopolysaccharide assembly protein LapA domain-containing protein [Deinococcus sp. YIM 134068]|uniref:lipopolysaccharide assembly protein LapA domain-containing protein n=1 Tax=Deinococcus lichenicola TaxID=3118910 RepID=UPI002F9536EB
MRLVPFVQVLLLLALAAYLLLVALENPAPVRLPLPLGRGELSVPAGVAVGGFTALGGAYALLLLLPPLWRAGRRGRRARRERAALEERLTSTLQARLGTLPGAAPTEVQVPQAPARSA